MIAQEVRDFLIETGLRAVVLSKASGIPQSTISNLVHGQRRNVFGSTQDKLRAAMRMLRAQRIADAGGSV